MKGNDEVRQANSQNQEQNPFKSNQQKEPQSQLQNGAKFHKPQFCQEECQFEKIFAVSQKVSLRYAELAVAFITCGLSIIALQWKPQWRLKWFFQIVPPQQSQAVFVFGYDGTVTYLQYLKDIQKDRKVFEFRFQRYVLQESDNAYAVFSDSAFTLTNQQILEMSKEMAFTSERQHESYERNGKNHTDVPDKGLFHLAFYELFSPFYFFQMGSVTLWLYEGYSYYSYVIIAMAVLGFIMKIFTERLNFLRLQKLSILRKEMMVQRKGARFEIPSDQVIFGDIVFLNKGEIANCDLIVIQGSAIVNESMLTGDSLPFAKSPLISSEDKFQEDRSYVIYSGSMILSQSKLKCFAFRVGFDTLRGNMIRSIMFPKKLLAASFDTDTVYFILIMGGAALLSFIVTLSTFIDKFNNHLITGKDVVQRCLDLVTISVPPALPTCINFGISFSMMRLKIRNIFCLNSQNVCTCGIVRTICFDKTGTLTENTLSYKMISGFKSKDNKFKDCEGPESYRSLSLIQRVIIGACHSLRVVNGIFQGDPLEVEMFKNSGCEISKKSGEQLQWEGYGVIQEIIIKDDQKGNDPEKADILESGHIQIQEGVEIENDQNMVQPISSNLISPQQNNEQLADSSNQDSSSKRNILKNKDKSAQGSEINFQNKDYLEINCSIDKNQTNKEGDSQSNPGFDHILEQPTFAKEITFLPLNAKQVDILKIFPFESKYERMSTLIRIDGNTYIITKGSPEKMKAISRPDTLPSSKGKLIETYEGKLSQFTKRGLRVIAMGYKQINAYDIGKGRKKLESNLIFTGFLVFENQLKPQTTQHLQLLKESEIQLSMVTGDNAQTSLSIARQCEIFSEKDQSPILLDLVDNQIISEQEDCSKVVENLEVFLKDYKEELVVTGQFFDKFFTPDKTKSNLNQIRHLLFKTRVFARMKPDQKQGLVSLLQGYASENGRTFIGLCGDGANDCQALKSADMGISLGETEASVAASFTSKVLNIGIIEVILREGRCCIVTQFQCFKFMALYSSIQVSTTAIMYYRGVTPGNYQFLFWDLFIVLPLAFFLGITQSSKKLALSLPAHRLFSATNVVSVLGLGVISLCFQIISVAATSNQSWYIDPITYQTLSGLDKSELLMNSFDNSVIFWTSNFQYLGVLISFSLFSVHKRPFYTNVFFTFYLILIIIFSLYLQFTTSSNVNDLFELQPQLTTLADGTLITEMEYEWRFAILAIIIGNLVIIFVFECYLRDKIVQKLEQRFPQLIYKGAATSNLMKKSVELVEVQSNPIFSSKEKMFQNPGGNN